MRHSVIKIMMFSQSRNIKKYYNVRKPDVGWFESLLKLRYVFFLVIVISVLQYALEKRNNLSLSQLKTQLLFRGRIFKIGLIIMHQQELCQKKKMLLHQFFKHFFKFTIFFVLLWFLNKISLTKKECTINYCINECGAE